LQESPIMINLLKCYIAPFTAALMFHASLLLFLALAASPGNKLLPGDGRNVIRVDIVSDAGDPASGSSRSVTKENKHPVQKEFPKNAQDNISGSPTDEIKIKAGKGQTQIHDSPGDSKSETSVTGNGEDSNTGNLSSQGASTTHLQSGVDIDVDGAGTGNFGTGGGFLSPPVPITGIKPVYPRMAQEAGMEGIVKVRVSIDEYGAIVHSEVVGSSAHSILDKAALSVINKTRFYPAKQNKKPIPLTAIITIKYKLE
jgi:TonB family protein